MLPSALTADDRACLAAGGLDVADPAVELRHRLDVNGEHIRAGRREVVDLAVRSLDHEVHVERTRGNPLIARTTGGPTGMVGTKCLSIPIARGVCVTPACDSTS